MSARSAVAQQHGATEDMLAAVDDHPSSDLAPAQRAALTLADAYLVSPAAMTDQARQEVAAHMNPSQVVELVLKLTGFSSDKMLVALGLDFDAVEIFTTD